MLGLPHIIPIISFLPDKENEACSGNNLPIHTIKFWCQDLIPGILYAGPVLLTTHFCQQQQN